MWLRGSPEHEAHVVDNDRVVDVRQRFEREENTSEDVVAPRRSLFDFDPPDSTHG